MINFCMLSSGSNGNVSLLQSGKTNLLIDCGRSASFIKENLINFNIKPEQITGALITHAHRDHINESSLKFLSDYNIPIYADRFVFEDMFDRFGDEKMQECVLNDLDVRYKTKINNTAVECFNVYHRDDRISCSVGFIIESVARGRNYRIGYITDTGKICQNIIKKLADCNILAIEANYDENMLAGSGRRQENKNWILSDMGHLSNAAAAKAIVEIKKISKAEDSLKYVFLSHISAQHNTQTLSLQTVKKELLKQNIKGVNLLAANRESRSKAIIIEDK